jgi:hypothetical protein
MAFVKNDILNLARAHLKLGPETDPSTSRNPTSLLLNGQYDAARKFVLSEAKWGFAKKDSSLSATTAPTHTFSQAFNLPADYVRLVTINGHDVDNLTFPLYELKTDSTGSLVQIHTNEPSPIKITYVFDQQNASTFTYPFTELLSYYLADLVVSEDNQLAVKIAQRLEEKLEKAKFFNADQSRLPVPNHYDNSDWDKAHG